MANFKMGEKLNGWEVRGIVTENGVTNKYIVSNGEVELGFITNAGTGENYSLPYYLEKNGRRYSAMRYLIKWVSIVQGLSNILFERYVEEEAKNANLFQPEDVISSLKEEDITHKWVIIKPAVVIRDFKPEYHDKTYQLVLAHGGFGCKGSALSSGGGKTYTRDMLGNNTTIYRSDIMGIAAPHVLVALDIPSTCPHCRKEAVLDALSRDNETSICSECGTKEAFEEMGFR